MHNFTLIQHLNQLHWVTQMNMEPSQLGFHGRRHRRKEDRRCIGGISSSCHTRTIAPTLAKHLQLMTKDKINNVSKKWKCYYLYY